MGFVLVGRRAGMGPSGMLRWRVLGGGASGSSDASWGRDLTSGSGHRYRGSCDKCGGVNDGC